MIAQERRPDDALEFAERTPAQTISDVIKRPEVVVDNHLVRQGEHFRVSADTPLKCFFPESTVLDASTRPEFLVLHVVEQPITGHGLEVADGFHVGDFTPGSILVIEPHEQFFVRDVAQDARQTCDRESRLNVLRSALIDRPQNVSHE